MSEIEMDALTRCRDRFKSGALSSVPARLQALESLRRAVREHEREIFQALHADLGRSDEESYIGEVGFLYEEIAFAKKHLRCWARPERVPTPLAFWPARSRIYREPVGTALILGPWNYPFQLVLSPLVGALSAGCTAVLKPSEQAAATSKILARVVGSAFPAGEAVVVEGGGAAARALLALRWDHIFFTGGGRVAKEVLAAAAPHLTPVTLELGGKNPCLVLPGGRLDVTARRIAWGKFFNAGQTCVAPDYLLVHRSVAGRLVSALGDAVTKFFGADPSKTPEYGRIVSARHFERLSALLKEGTAAVGGGCDPATRYIAPTVLTGVKPDAQLMQEEIFGPILPVLEYGDLDEAMAFVSARPKPLSLYVFGGNAAERGRVLKGLSFGGGCANDTLIHLGNPRLPFGGVGESGTGAYHGRHGFETFSHRKSVVLKPFWGDLPFRYPPFAGRLPLLRRLLGGTG